MADDILSQIVKKRKEDIARLGYDFGFNVPETRKRILHPFVAKKCVILEIKRASPSKGLIAPSLDERQTAIDYAKAGAGAISCLTESNYFSGNLHDLMNVADTLDALELQEDAKIPALLRKDFLIDEKDIEISYRAGADAVLLIARILTKEKIVSMAQKCEKLGLSMLLEVRKDDDLGKLCAVNTAIGNKNLIICGVNARDLADFSIDMLYPSQLLQEIRSILGTNARVVFESGVRSPRAASFCSKMGFSALLLGEAAAKNPTVAETFVQSFLTAMPDSNSKMWEKVAKHIAAKKKISSAPLVKICGLTRSEDAIKAL